MCPLVPLSRMKHSLDCKASWENGLCSATKVTSMSPAALDTWQTDGRTGEHFLLLLHNQGADWMNISSRWETPVPNRIFTLNLCECYLVELCLFPVGDVHLAVVTLSFGQLRLLPEYLHRGQRSTGRGQKYFWGHMNTWWGIIIDWRTITVYFFNLNVKNWQQSSEVRIYNMCYNILSSICGISIFRGHVTCSVRVITSSILSGSAPSSHIRSLARPHRSSSRIPLDTCQSINKSVTSRDVTE